MIKSIFEILMPIAMGLPQLPPPRGSTRKNGTMDKLSRGKERQPLPSTRCVGAYEKKFEAVTKQRAATGAN
jgi:hypothetical protein